MFEAVSTAPIRQRDDLRLDPHGFANMQALRALCVRRWFFRQIVEQNPPSTGFCRQEFALGPERIPLAAWLQTVGVVPAPAHGDAKMGDVVRRWTRRRRCEPMNGKSHRGLVVLPRAIAHAQDAIVVGRRRAHAVGFETPEAIEVKSTAYGIDHWRSSAMMSCAVADIGSSPSARSHTVLLPDCYILPHQFDIEVPHPGESMLVAAQRQWLFGTAIQAIRSPYAISSVDRTHIEPPLASTQLSELLHRAIPEGDSFSRCHSVRFPFSPGV